MTSSSFNLRIDHTGRQKDGPTVRKVGERATQKIDRRVITSSGKRREMEEADQEDNAKEQIMTSSIRQTVFPPFHSIPSS